MKIIALITGLLLLPIQAGAETICDNLQKDELRSCLQEEYRPEETLSYKEARKEMFSHIDNVDGKVELVYSGVLFATEGIPDHTIVNTEHTWPQSKFRDRRIKSDLHHLFPTHNRINGIRGNLPFAEIPDQATERWLIRNDKGKRRLPPETERDNYSEWIPSSFEPREAHKGDVARAMFYVYGIYDHDRLNTDWFKGQIDTLLPAQWDVGQ